MLFQYDRWPFLTTNLHTPEQSALWWQACYTKHSVVESFINVDGAAAFLSGPGNGKSTAIAAVARTHATDCLILPYSPLNWPHGLRPWLSGRGHVSQVMAAAATEIISLLEDSPNLVSALNPLQKEFLFWLISKHLGQRTLSRLKYHLISVLGAGEVLPDSVEDIYPSDTLEADIWGQISELAELAVSLKFQRIILLVDISDREFSSSENDLIVLLNLLDLMEHPSWHLKMSLPYSQTVQKLIEVKSNGRLQLFYANYDIQDIQNTVGHYINMATSGQVHSVDALASKSVRKQAATVIRADYGEESLAGWLYWAETLLYLRAQLSDETISDADNATLHFYARHMPLRLDPYRHGVWRGPQFFPLDGQPYEVVTKLFSLKGQSAPDALVKVAGSGQNLNTIMSRLRKTIEPLQGTNVYLHNRRDQGYWLENFIL